MTYPWSAGDRLDAVDLNDIFNFGGDGSDGNTTISSNTDIDAGATTYAVKNYNDLTINAGVTLGLTNVHTTFGSVLHIRVLGNLILNGTIDVSELGGIAGVSITSNFASGQDGSPGAFSRLPAKKGRFSVLVNTGVGANFHVTDNQFGEGGAPGQNCTGTNADPGGGGGGGGYLSASDGSNGTNGGTNCTFLIFKQIGGVGGKAHMISTTGVQDNMQLLSMVFAGAGGASGGTGSSTPVSGVGGRGSGGLILEVAGDITFGASSVINVSGENGSNATGLAAGGGGGGGGIAMILYRGTLTDNGVTETISGGTAGTGSSGGGNASAGGDGKVFTISLSMER